MTLQEKISQDLKDCIKNGNEDKKSLLRVIIGELNRKGKVLSDDIVLSEINKLKQNAILMKNDNEVAILDSYLPKTLSDDELKIVINNIIIDNNLSGKQHMVKVMSELKAKYNAQYDGKIASDIIKQKLT